MSDINTSVLFLENLITVLDSNVVKYRRLFLSTREEQMRKVLDVFILELTRNYSKIMKATSIINSFNTGQVEESDLYTSISLKTCNEQVDAYNKLISEFDSMKSYLKKGELITSNGQVLLLEVFNEELRTLVGSRRDEGYSLWEALSSKTRELKQIGSDTTLLPIEKASSDPKSEIAPKKLRRVVTLSAFDSMKPKSIRRLKNRENRRTFEYICKPDAIPPIQRVEIKEDSLQLALQQESPKELVDENSAENLARFPLKSVQKSGPENSLLHQMEENPIRLDSQTSNSKHGYQSIDEFVKKPFSENLARFPLKSVQKSGPENSLLHQMEENPIRLDSQTSNSKHGYQSIDEFVKKPFSENLARFPLKSVQKSGPENSLLHQMEENSIRLDSQTSNSKHGYQSIDEFVKKPFSENLARFPLKKLQKSGLDGSLLHPMEGNLIYGDLKTSNLENENHSIDELVKKRSAEDLSRLPLENVIKSDLDNSYHNQKTNLIYEGSQPEYQSIDGWINKRSPQNLTKLQLKTKESNLSQSDTHKPNPGYISLNQMKTNPTFKDSLSKLQHTDKFIDKQFAQHLSKPPLQECCLLPNANKNPTYPSEGKMFILKNSCGFDSIAQILLANVTDYPNFENASQQNSQIIDLILKLRASPCSKAASLRDDYLVSKNIALAKSDGNAPSLTIDLFGTIFGVWEKYFDELPSAYRRFTCHPENRSKKSAFEIVKLGPTRKISIEEELDSFTKDKLRCHLCNNMSETYFELQNYLFIDLTIHAGSKKYKCRLNMFPEKLTFLRTKLRLAGVIEGDSEHFKAYVRRINGDWELYDDLKEKVTKSFAFDVIAPEAVVYIRE
ncbi:hypothetical protein KQX54_012074 [Cotesia glomerata]|uniref:Uncharacterized protein n=1 Tax=Cotesia glomerata TaxID=32391 RepID=A0AAV7IPV9_COTGL|nr:hypothetical protein KQX54_012074 [Cotesia glomerata]